ncbi:sugar phosphate isomerase/epimerase family protein [Streptomyces sp. L7]
MTAAAGAHHLVLIPPMYRDEKTGAFTESPELTAGPVGGLRPLRPTGSAGCCSTSTTYDLVVHPHADSHIQTQPEIERLLNESDSRYTNLCLDTGHVAYGGGDNLDLIRRFGERVGYVHIKQMDLGRRRPSRCRGAVVRGGGQPRRSACRLRRACRTRPTW